MTCTAHRSNLSLDGSAKRRAAYTLAAGAAACTAASSATAEVQYSGLQNINIGSGFSQQIDLNYDGFNDVKLTNYVFGQGPYQGATVNFAPGRFVGFNVGPLSYVSALTVYDPIGSANAGPTFFGSLAYGAANPNAEFNNVSNAFIGLSFPVGDKLLYGWLRVAIDNANKSFLIKDWAYNDGNVAALAGTVTDGILAGDTGDGYVPEPGTLGMLAAGAAGVIGLRRRRQTAGK
jgi:hypothetical protein